MITRLSLLDRRWTAPVAGLLLFAVGLLAAAPDGHAAGPNLSQDTSWRQRIDDERLFLDPAWLALLSYRSRPWGTGWISDADRREFFLSADGHRDPRAELIATVAAQFSGDRAHTGDEDPRCRFPARFSWLQGTLGLEPDYRVEERCAALGAWYASVAAHSASIHYASAYLESPSSTFGHTFLRFARDGVPVLRTSTANYEADSSRQTGLVAFVVRGLFGGFPGKADVLPFYRRLRVYGDIEGRDVWEYPLRLNPAQLRILLLNLWEEKDGVFDYFFVGENCSYRTLALIAAVQPDAGLLDGFPLEAVPIETVRALQRRGLVGEPVYWPSAVRTLAWHARDFSADDRRAVVAAATGALEPSRLQDSPTTSRARLLRAAAEYSSILIHRGHLDFDTRDRVTTSLLRERLALDGPPQPPDAPPAPPSPDTAHAGRMASIGWVSRRGIDALELAVAGFQHERIDRLAGYETGAELAVLGARLRFTENGGTRLERFDLLRVESTAPSDRFFSRPAWSLHAGARRKPVDGARPVVATFGAARGRAFDLGPGVLALTLGADLDAGKSLRGAAAMEAVGAATFTRQHERVSGELFVEHGRYLVGDDSHRLEYGMRIGIPLSRRYGLVLAVERGGADSSENQVRVELRSFF